MKPKFSNSIVRGRVAVATYGSARLIPNRIREEHIYHIRNLQTEYTLFTGNDYKWALHVFYSISKRKNGDIVLLNMETGEVLKIKKAKNAID